MHEQLQSLRDAWSPEDKEARNEVVARGLAEEIVSSHPEWYSDYQGKELAELVKAAETFRAAGMENEQWKVEAYLLAKFQPQKIGGEYQAEVRLSDNA